MQGVVIMLWFMLNILSKSIMFWLNCIAYRLLWFSNASRKIQAWFVGAVVCMFALEVEGITTAKSL